MPQNAPAGGPSLPIGRRAQPRLKEFTLEMGDSDVYVKMSNEVSMGGGKVLYEAILTDDRGSRTIFISREEILESLKDMFLKEPKAEDVK